MATKMVTMTYNYPYFDFYKTNDHKLGVYLKVNVIMVNSPIFRIEVVFLSEW